MRRQPRAFTLVELVMVVTIIGIVAAIAAPRVSSASRSANAHSLAASVTNVRKAIDMYFAEHGRYPGYISGTNTPDGSAFIDQLTKFSNEQGQTSDTFVAGNFMFGPYVRKPFPKNPTNKLDSVHVKSAPSDADPADGSVGWVAVLSHGYFGISASDADLDEVGVIEMTKKKVMRTIAP